MSDARGTRVSGCSIRELDINCKDDIDQIWQMWQTIFPTWPIARDRMQDLLTVFPGHHRLHEHGFHLAFLVDDVHGKLGAVGVLPEYRRRGIGTALIEDARSRLRQAALSTGATQLASFEIGGSIPRFWPQMPADLPQEVKGFFTRADELRVRALYRDIRQSVVAPEMLERASESKMKFRVWSPELVDECIEKQRALFPWPRRYEILAEYKQFDQVMVAIDPETDKQVGWTVMCDPTSIVSQAYAFIPLMPSGNKTGLIAAVGVDESVRGKGVGLALMVKALENLRKRGIEGVFIDSVERDSEGFYERLGFDTKWRYEVWKHT